MPGAPAKTFGRGGISKGSLGLHPASFSTRSQKPSPSVSASTRVRRHTPFVHTSCMVQGLVSSHTKPSRALASWVQPPCGSHPSRVQGLPSSHVCGSRVPLQVPPVQVSPVVHEFPSSQLAPSIFVGCVHVPAPLH